MPTYEPRVVGAITQHHCPECFGPTAWVLAKYGIAAGCTNYKGGCGDKPSKGFVKNARGPGAAPAYVTRPLNPWFTPEALSEYRATGRRTSYSDGENPPDGYEPQLTVPAVQASPATPTPPPEKPMPAPTPAPAITPAVPTPTPGAPTAGDALWQIVGGNVAAYVANAVATAVADAVKHAGPAVVEWKVNAVPFAKSEGHRHAVHGDILRAIGAGFNNLMLVGPAGSGKTSLAENLAKDLGRPFVAISASGGTTESTFIGRAVPNLTTGEVAHQTTEYLTAFEGGGVILIDEWDAMDPTVALLQNAALANGWLPVPTRPDKPRAVRHADTIIIAAANTYGMGADRQYTGRNQLDAATLDRFVGATFTVDYDRDLEARLTGDPALCARVWEIRKAVETNKLRRIVGTRFLLSARRWTAAGDTADTAIRKCLTGWTEQELSKVGMA